MVSKSRTWLILRQRNWQTPHRCFKRYAMQGPAKLAANIARVNCLKVTNSLTSVDTNELFADTTETSLCSASYVSWQRGTARIGPPLLRRGCCWAYARRPCSNRSIYPASRAHSSKPAACCCSGRIGQICGQTDRRTDGRTPYRTLSLSSSASNDIKSQNVRDMCNSRAEHLIVESYTVIICQQSYLLLFGIPSPTHSFIPDKTFLFCKSFPPQPFLFLLHDSLHGFPRLFTVISF